MRESMTEWMTMPDGRRHKRHVDHQVVTRDDAAQLRRIREIETDTVQSLGYSHLRFPSFERLMSDGWSRDANIVGSSGVIRSVFDLARRVAAGDAKVLVTGESGVGKDVVARFIHAHSPRASRAFVAVNCAGLSETLLESELFGHVKGSFTGAYRDKVGRLQLAHRGTVFLDELGEMSLRMQALLLRFLENGEIQPVGGENVAATVNVRVIAATNRDIEQLVVDGIFREDLLYRIKVVHLHVPPLRERREDLRPLLADLIRRTGRKIWFTEEALELMSAYSWPGNVRELANVVEQVSWLAGQDCIGPEHLPGSIRDARVPDAALAPDAPPGPAERKREVADDLYSALSSGEATFWESVYAQFIKRDLTRHDVRELVRRGLATANGNYRAMLPLFGIQPTEYKRFLNFLAAHDCVVDYRLFRSSGQSPLERE
jgi:transcriptional regulator with GAF, ATPase, and Fis domain